MATNEFSKDGGEFGYEYALYALLQLAKRHNPELLKDVAETLSDEPASLARGVATLSMALELLMKSEWNETRGVHSARFALQIMSACVAAGIEIQEDADCIEVRRAAPNPQTA